LCYELAFDGYQFTSQKLLVQKKLALNFIPCQSYNMAGWRVGLLLATATSFKGCELKPSRLWDFAALQSAAETACSRRMFICMRCRLATVAAVIF